MNCTTSWQAASSLSGGESGDLRKTILRLKKTKIGAEAQFVVDPVLLFQFHFVRCMAVSQVDVGRPSRGRRF